MYLPIVWFVVIYGTALMVNNSQLVNADCDSEGGNAALCQTGLGKVDPLSSHQTRRRRQTAVPFEVKDLKDGQSCCTHLLLYCGLFDWDRKCHKSQESQVNIVLYEKNINKVEVECRVKGFAMSDAFCAKQNVSFSTECQPFLGKYCAKRTGDGDGGDSHLGVTTTQISRKNTCPLLIHQSSKVLTIASIVLVTIVIKISH